MGMQGRRTIKNILSAFDTVPASPHADAESSVKPASNIYEYVGSL
jgi:hypothetical protein